MKITKFLMAVFLITNLYALNEIDIKPIMQTNINKATDILAKKNMNLSKKSSEIFSLFDNIFDYTLMAKLSLGGKQWKSLDEKQQNTFVKTFEDKLKRSYFEKLKLYNDEKMVVKSLNKLNDKRIYLKSEILGQDENYEVNYKFYLREDNQWYIYDVDVLGVSVIKTYKGQFNNILNSISFDNLIAQLKKD